MAERKMSAQRGGPKEAESQVRPEGHRPHDEPLIRALTKTIRMAVRALAILMTGVIVWGVFDVMYVLYERLIEPPFLLLNINDILATFGAFMAVLIAIDFVGFIAQLFRKAPKDVETSHHRVTLRLDDGDAP